eukprot:m.236946 g.236946  ORF g.236946 m.236946 type:complete len:530 (+) comp20855_c0_seq1:50-1639(+)
MKIHVFLFLGCLALVSARSAQEWKTRVIYQVLTDRLSKQSASSQPCNFLGNYCGGTFQGIISRLDYIQSLGVNAIWISPVVENTDGGYHGYWAKNIYNVNSHFGNSSDLRALVDACHARDIWVMVDVVANHMGNQPGAKDDFSMFTPFNKPEHYHSYCDIQNWNDQHQVEVCRLAGLPDLAQENQYVSDTLVTWIGNLVKQYGFDGIRIDTIPEVSKDFWAKYVPAATVFAIGEVDNGNTQYNANYQPPLDATLNYPFYWTLRDVFTAGHSMREIHDRVEEEKTGFRDRSVLGLFLDNHDNPRFLNLKNDYTQLKNGLAYVLLAEGIPIVYYGTEQGFAGGNDPANREDLWRSSYNRNHQLYQYISLVLKFRAGLPAAYFAAEQIERYVDDQFFAFTRDQVFVATTNIGCCGSITRHITYHPYHEGTVLVNIFDSRDRLTVHSGAFDVVMTQGAPKIYYPQSSLDNGNSQDTEAQTGSMSGAATAGTVVGVVAGIALFALVVFVVLRRRQAAQTRSESIPLLPSSTVAL